MCSRLCAETAVRSWYMWADLRRNPHLTRQLASHMVCAHALRRASLLECTCIGDKALLSEQVARSCQMCEISRSHQQLLQATSENMN